MLNQRLRNPRPSRPLPFAVSVGLLLGACAADQAVDPTGNDLESHAEVSFEDFMSDCVESGDGLLCQGDLRIAADRDPYEFWATFIAHKLGQSTDAPAAEAQPASPDGVGVAAQALSKNGKQGDANLTYCVRNTSPNGFTAAQAAAVRAGLVGAANMWAPYVSIRYQYVSAEDAQCDASNTRVDFHVRAMTTAEINDDPQTAAFAFFPGDSRGSRVIAIRTGWIPSSNNASFTNLLAHELGHTLGFVHEQYRDPTTGCQDTSNAGSALTRYDAASIMHYQECNGRNFGGLSTYDIRGAQCSYLGNCEWIRLPGRGLDIGVGSNNTAWIIGTNGTPYRYDWQLNSWIQQPGGNGMRIAVDSSGIAWMVNTSNYIYRWTPTLTSGSWTRMPGKAIDIGIGGPASNVWIIGTNGKMYQWNGSDWVMKAAGANGWRITVASDNRPWIITTNGSIYVENGNGWLQQPGSGMDIGAGRDGSIWLVGSGSIGGGYELFEYVPSSGGTSLPSWTKTTGGGVNIAVGGPIGTPWLVNNEGSLYRNRWE